MNKTRMAFLIVILICLFLTSCEAGPNKERAAKRAREYAEAINYHYDSPERIYSLLCKEYKKKISEESFTAAFQKERSYPYITPLYLMENPDMVYADDLRMVETTYLQAARIAGMTYTVQLIWENGDYYVQDWSELIDGSYLKKFEDIPYSLDWYYDINEENQYGDS